MLTKGLNWVGNPAIANRIVRQPCRLWVGLDSLHTTSYSSGDTANTSLPYGIVRNWQPKKWSGIVLPSNSQGGNNIISSTTFVGVTNGASATYTPGATLLGGALASNLIPCPAALLDFSGLPPEETQFKRHHLNLAENLSQYAVGDWPSTILEAMVATEIFLRHANGAVVKVESYRPFETVAGGFSLIDSSGATGISGQSYQTPITGTQPGLKVLTGLDAFDPTGKQYISVATRLRSISKVGFELAIMGIGGTSVKQHASNTSLYSETALAQFLAQTESDTFWLMIGANGGLNPDEATFTADLLNLLTKYRNAANAAGITSPRFVLLNTYSISTNTDAVTQTVFDIIADIVESYSDILGINTLDLVGDTTGLLVNEGGNLVHPTRAGSDFIALTLWQALEELSNQRKSNSWWKQALTRG